MIAAGIQRNPNPGRRHTSMKSATLSRTLLAVFALLISSTTSKARSSEGQRSAQILNGKRIVTLKGFGDYYAKDGSGRPHIIHADALGVNIVAEVHHVDGHRIWIKANGAGDVA